MGLISGVWDGVPGDCAERMNLLIITTDDLGAESVGAFGCRLPDTTPNIDRLANQGMRFLRAHVQVANCMPSRNVMWSALYPHNNRVEGFYQVKDPDYPILMDLLKEAGYFMAIRHKVGHSTPYQPYPWDLVLDTDENGTQLHPKDPQSYGRCVARGIQAARKAGKPFFLMINLSDPHKPFFGEGARNQPVDDPFKPSRVFSASEVPVPGFLFDDPVVRKELARYYSTVRRADDAVGTILQALADSGEGEKTFILFLSDHGMPLPFAKTQLYHHSTWTPLIICWPGVTRPGSIDSEHMVSAVDLMPTLLDVVGLEKPQRLDGRSFAPLLRGEPMEGFDHVFKEYNENSGGSREPMRAVQTKRYLYIFNPWSNGDRIMATATTGTDTYRRMVTLAATDQKLAARLNLFQHRVVEELYDVEKDPDCLVNLINANEHKDELDKLRAMLLAWMERTGDHMLPVFKQRDDPAVRESYVVEKEREAAARRKAPARKTRTDETPRARKGKDLIRLEVPTEIKPGEKATVQIVFSLPKELGTQMVHVTLKGGRDARRLDRQVFSIEGKGTLDVTFQIPDMVPDDQVSFAAFVGEDFPNCLQHVQTQPVMVTRRSP